MRADINLEQIHNYISDLFTAAGLKEEFSHYILSVSCDYNSFDNTLKLNLELSSDRPCKNHPYCISIVTTKSHTFDYSTPIDEFAYQIAKMTQALNDTLGNEKTHPIPLDLPKGWYRDLYLPRKVDMLDALHNAIGHFWPDTIDYTKFSEEKKKRPQLKLHPYKESLLQDLGRCATQEYIDLEPYVVRKACDSPFDMAVNTDSFTPVNIILNKGEDTMNFTAEQKKALDQINIDASAKQAELEADRQKAIEDLKNDAEIEALRRDLDKLAWKRHTFYQSLMDQGFNSEQAMQILLNEF